MRTLDELKKNENLQIADTAFDGGHGIIRVSGWIGSIVWSFGGGWEHVSVAPFNNYITPSWRDMCIIKDIFFNEDECVVQYHPAKSEYVNIKDNCLHLWRPLNEKMPVPPIEFV